MKSFSQALPVVALSAVVLSAVLTGLCGCTRSYREDIDYSYDVVQTWTLEELKGREIVQFQSVFWEPDDTISLRMLIVNEQAAMGRDVLEIGTGTGILGILCLQNGADKLVVTDINPAAVSNAKYNAAMLIPEVDIDVRQVDEKSPGAFSVIKSKEKFDLIISNPPWEDGTVQTPGEYAFIDPGFALMDSLLDGLPKHLNRGGRCLLAYGNVTAIKRLMAEAKARSLECKLLDDRSLDDLEDNFLPGMVVEIRVPMGRRLSTSN